MNITINIVELASELADNDLMQMQSKAIDRDAELPFPNGIVREEEVNGEEIVVYTDEAQEMFNIRYDYWWDFIWNYKVGEDE